MPTHRCLGVLAHAASAMTRATWSAWTCTNARGHTNPYARSTAAQCTGEAAPSAQPATFAGVYQQLLVLEVGLCPPACLPPCVLPQALWQRRRVHIRTTTPPPLCCCRQKTIDRKTTCASCGTGAGIWCGNCLDNRMGESIAEVGAATAGHVSAHRGSFQCHMRSRRFLAQHTESICAGAAADTSYPMLHPRCCRAARWGSGSALSAVTCATARGRHACAHPRGGRPPRSWCMRHGTWATPRWVSLLGHA